MFDVAKDAAFVESGTGSSRCAVSSGRSGACPRQECRDLRQQVQYRTAMHRRAMERQAFLRAELAEVKQENLELRKRVEDLEAQLSLKNKLLFAPSTEKETDEPRQAGPKGKSRRRRGHQPGAKGHGRRPTSHLPAVVEERDVPEDEKCCPQCGEPLEPFPPDEECEQIEVEVRAHRRVYRRKRYRSTCRCPGTPGVVCGPPAPALVPKGRYGVSIFVWFLLDKFYLLRPTYRLVKDLAGHGLFLAQGTITDNLRRLGPFFEPVYLALREKSLLEDHWHADETGWLVFEKTSEGGAGRKRYLWIFHSPSTVLYVLDPSRGSEVPRAFFDGRADGIISADRYSAYKSLEKDGMVLIAFCWAHVRRDFLRVRDGYAKHTTWGQTWVDRIAKLYELNDRRLSASGDAFGKASEKLRRYLIEMEQIFTEELAGDPPGARRKVLQSLKNHWEGLTLFYGFPEVPLDNNAAERLLRSPVVGRKNFYGSGTEWSGRLAAMMFSIFQTLTLWRIEPRRWLTWYLGECAERRGLPPEDVSRFLPWNLSAEELARLSATAVPNTS